MKLKTFFFLLCNFCCLSDGEGGSIRQLVGKYPCDNRILFGFENSNKVDTFAFQRQINFLSNYTFEQWSHVDYLDLLRFGDFGYATSFKSVDDVKHYVESSIKSTHTICDVFLRLVSLSARNTQIILFANELSLSDLEDDCVTDLRELTSRGSQFAFVPLSDKFNQTLLKHYFNQATIIQWDITKSETPKDWEQQFNAFYNCDHEATTIENIGNTQTTPKNSYPPCNTDITIAFDKSNGLTNTEYRQERDFLINRVFQKWTNFDRLNLISFADHVYSSVISPENIDEIVEFIQTEEQVDTNPDLCNLFKNYAYNFYHAKGPFVVFLSTFNETDFEKQMDDSKCGTFLNPFWGNFQITFVLLHDSVDTAVLRNYIPQAQFIEMTLSDIAPNWEWQFLTAYGCNKDNANDQTAYPYDGKFIVAYEVSTAVDSNVLELQRDFLLNQVFDSNWNVFNNLAVVAYSSETSIQDFGTMNNLDDVHIFIKNSMDQFAEAPASLCSLFRKLTTMYLLNVNIILFASEFHEQAGDDCQIWIKQLRYNANYINLVNLTENVNTQYFLSNLPQSTFTSWNIKQNRVPDSWGRESFGWQNFVVSAKSYPCSGSFTNVIIYDRSQFLTPFAYQKLISFLNTKVFIKQWSSYFNIYTYPEDSSIIGTVRSEMEIFIRTHLQVNGEEPFICQVLNSLAEGGIEYSNLIFFVSKFDKTNFEMDETCAKSVRRIERYARSITFIKLTLLVNSTLMRQTFPDATIVDWDIEQDREFANWNQLLWEAFGCPGYSPIMYPQSTSTLLPRTSSLITTTKIPIPSKPNTHLKTTRMERSKTIKPTGKPRKVTTLSSPNNVGLSSETIILLAVFIPILLISIITFAILGWCYRKLNQELANIKPIQLRNNEYTFEIQRDPWELPQECLRIDFIEKLGSGEFGEVFLGKLLGDAPIKKIFADSQYCQKFHNCDVAVKTLPRMQVNDRSRVEFKKEIDFMRKLKFHVNLVCFLGYVEDPTNPLLLLEYCANGDLLHFLRLNKQKFVENFEGQAGADCKTLVSFAWQVSNGLEYLHSLNLIHRDVAARNILLDKTNICKISDFGHSRLAGNLAYQSNRDALRIRWMAIEAIKGNIYTPTIDVWSYGVLLYEIFTLGDLPYLHIQNILEYIESGKRLEKPEYCSDKLYKLMLACWNAEPQKRPRFIIVCKFMEKLFETATLHYNYVEASTEQSDEV